MIIKAVESMPNIMGVSQILSVANAACFSVLYYFLCIIVSPPIFLLAALVCSGALTVGFGVLTVKIAGP
jgi:hypothetical protein